MIESNRCRKTYAIKYYILAAMLAMASLWVVPTVWHAFGKIIEAYRSNELTSHGPVRVVGAAGFGIAQAAEEVKQGNRTLQIGLLEPIALTVRSLTASILPPAQRITESVYTENREYWYG